LGHIYRVKSGQEPDLWGGDSPDFLLIYGSCAAFAQIIAKMSSKTQIHINFSQKPYQNLLDNQYIVI